jgi:hypothetical protein
LNFLARDEVPASHAHWIKEHPLWCLEVVCRFCGELAGYLVN